jgi:Copper chaperone PCu(A)C
MPQQWFGPWSAVALPWWSTAARRTTCWFPDDLASFLIGGNDARWPVSGWNDEISPQCCAAIDELFFLMGLHAPDDAANITGAPIDLVKHTPGIGDIKEAVLGKRRRLGTEPDRPTGASTPVAGKVEVHEMTMENGIMQMRPLTSGLEIKSGQTVELKPDSFHLMLENLKEPIQQGKPFNATLTLRRLGRLMWTLSSNPLAPLQRQQKTCTILKQSSALSIFDVLGGKFVSAAPFLR